MDLWFEIINVFMKCGVLDHKITHMLIRTSFLATNSISIGNIKYEIVASNDEKSEIRHWITLGIINSKEYLPNKFNAAKLA